MFQVEDHLQWQNFSRGGAAKLLFGIIFAENCMNMKKNWTERGVKDITDLIWSNKGILHQLAHVHFPKLLPVNHCYCPQMKFGAR